DRGRETRRLALGCSRRASVTQAGGDSAPDQGGTGRQVVQDGTALTGQVQAEQLEAEDPYGEVVVVRTCDAQPRHLPDAGGGAEVDDDGLDGEPHVARRDDRLRDGQLGAALAVRADRVGDGDAHRRGKGCASAAHLRARLNGCAGAADLRGHVETAGQVE